MSKEEFLIMVLFWGAAVITSIKWYQINLKIQKMNKITCKCSDVIKRTTYAKSYYIYFYTFKIKKEEHSISDQVRFKLLFFNPRINDILIMYVDNENVKDYLSPLDVVMQKVKIVIAVTCLFIPLLAII